LLRQNFWLQQQKIYYFPNIVAVTKPFFRALFIATAVAANYILRKTAAADKP